MVLYALIWSCMVFCILSYMFIPLYTYIVLYTLIWFYIALYSYISFSWSWLSLSRFSWSWSWFWIYLYLYSLIRSYMVLYGLIPIYKNNPYTLGAIFIILALHTLLGLLGLGRNLLSSKVPLHIYLGLLNCSNKHSL